MLQLLCQFESENFQDVPSKTSALIQLYVHFKASPKLGWNEMDVELLSKSEPWSFLPASQQGRTKWG